MKSWIVWKNIDNGHIYLINLSHIFIIFAYMRKRRLKVFYFLKYHVDVLLLSLIRVFKYNLLQFFNNILIILS